MQCSCGNPAASACRKQQCGRCCLGCAKHPRKPPPGEPGSCECGQVASPACDNWLCAGCCNGCSRHTYSDDSDESCYSEEPMFAPPQPFYSTAPQPGEPGSCSCGQIASPQCDNHLCANCCSGCSRHAYEESESEAGPQPGEPGSCSCGQVASPQCDHLLCANCCSGCSRHGCEESESEAGPQPGESGSCSCGQTASPECDHLLCANCCSGCSRHAYEESEAGPEPGEPGSCSCGQTASPQCDHLLCANCCNGCSRHAYEESEAEAGPSSGEPGSCSCGQTASPLCDNHLCASCCNGCSRHTYAGDTDEESVQYAPEPQQYAPEPPPQQPQHMPCDSCMQHGSRHCSMLRCRNCCARAPAGAICCPYHNHRVPVYEDYSEPSEDSIELQELFLHGVADGFFAAAAARMGPSAQPQQPQPPRCMCGQAAALTCSMHSCASCCYDLACTRHGAVGLEHVQGGPGLRAEMSMSGLAQVLMGYGFNSLSRMGPAAVDPGVIGSAWQGLGTDSNPAGRSAQSAGASAAAGSSSSSAAAAAARVSDTAAGVDQRAAAAGAGPSSSSASGVHKAGMPASEAEEALFQLKHCVVCLDEPRSVLLLPCKHLVPCGGCMAQMQRQVRQDFASGSSDETDVKCPVCRELAASMLPGVILS